jgi:hypothetical protein
MAKNNVELMKAFEAEEEKIRRMIGRAARTGAIKMREKILSGSPTGSKWHARINRMRGNQYGARVETGKMLESVHFSRPVWDAKTKSYSATFGFPYSSSGFKGIRNSRASAKYASRLDGMKDPSFRPWGIDKNYMAMQEYGSEMPGSNVRVGMHSGEYGMLYAKKQLREELAKHYKKGK